MDSTTRKQTSFKWAVPGALFLFLVLTAGFFALNLQAAQSDSDTEDEVTQLRQNRVLNAVVPIGGIVPYYGNPKDLRDTGCWQLCNGDRLADGADPRLHARMDDVPDLQGCFIRGATSGYDDDFVFAYGGSNVSKVETRDTLEAGQHRHRVDSHHHDLPARTGPVADNVRLRDLDHPGDWKNENDEVVDHAEAHGGIAGNEGQHLHELGGSTANENPLTDSQSGHSHAVPETEISIVPRHAELHYIMRIR